MKRYLIAVSLVCVLCSALGSRASAQTYDIDWHVIAGGGATSIPGGNYELGGTVGQWMASSSSSPLTGGPYSLVSGFWWPTTDSDGDGVLDIDDNCDNLVNPDQTDCDGDGIGNACDATIGTPSITTQPQSSVACAGGDAHISVIAAGANLTYQWRKGGAGIADGPTGNGSTYGGVTTSILTIVGATAVDSGTYDVVIAGSCPPVLTSSTATLTVAAGTCTKWTGQGDGISWHHSANWSGGVPTTTSDAIIDDSVIPSASVLLDANAVTVHTLTLGGASGTQSLFVNGQSLTTTAGLSVVGHGALTVNNTTMGGPGTLTNAGAVTLISTNLFAPFNNNGSITIRGGCTIGSPAGTFVTSASSIINVVGADGQGAATLNFSNGFTNSGQIVLSNIHGTGAAGSTLGVFGGPLVNAGSISTIFGTHGGARTLNLKLDNQGQFNINLDTSIDGSGGASVNTGDITVTGGNVNWTLDHGSLSSNAGGHITVPAGSTLTLMGGNTDQPLPMFNYNGGTFSGAGTLMLTGNTLRTNLNTNFNNTLGKMQVNSAYIIGSGTLINSTELEMIGSNINTPITNNGLLRVRWCCNGIGSPAGTFTNNGILRMSGDNVQGLAGLGVGNGFINAGTIELTNVNNGYGATLQVTNGTVLNTPTGRIDALIGQGGGSRNMTMRVDNQGQINFERDATFDSSNGPSVNSSAINVTGGNVDWTIGNGSLTNNAGGQIAIAAGRTLSFIGGGTSSYIHNPGSSLSGAGTLALTGNNLQAFLNTSFTNNFAKMILNNARIVGPESFTNATELEMIGGVFYSPLNNNGLLRVRWCCNTIDSPPGTFVNAATGRLQMSGDNQQGGAGLTVTNGFTSNGTIELTNANSGQSATLQVNNGPVVNLGTLAVLNGAGGGGRSMSIRLDNHGQFNVELPTNLNGPGGSNVNSGAVNVTGGDLNWDLGGGSLFNNSAGQISVAASRMLNLSNGNLTNCSGGLLNGGTYNIAGIFKFNNANIVTNSAAIVLDGPASAILDQSNGNALASFATNTASGAFTIKNGRNFSRNGGFSNSGMMQIGPGGSSFTLTSDYIQAAGSTVVADATLTAPNIVLLGGTLGGGGTINGTIANSGILNPGASPGCLSIAGDYIQSAAGQLQIELAGPSPCPAPQYDRLIVSGNATLGGTLAVSMLGGYDPPVGTTFDIVAAGSITGQFASHNLPLNFSNNCRSFPAYNPTSVRLTALQGAQFTQQPQGQSACVGGSAMLAVAASGEPPFTYQWRRNGQTLSGATNSTLSISPVSLANAGDYDCVVTNICGARFSGVGTLAVFATGTGDGDGSNSLNGRDIQEMINALLGGGQASAGYCAYDFTADGLVTSADIQLFISTLVP